MIRGVNGFWKDVDIMMQNGMSKEEAIQILQDDPEDLIIAIRAKLRRNEGSIEIEALKNN